MKFLIAGLLTLSCLQADTLYSNLNPANDTLVSLFFTDPEVLTEAGDQIQFSSPSSFLDLARIGVYYDDLTPNRTQPFIQSDVTLRIYNVDTSGATPLRGSLIDSFTLINQTFNSGAVQLIDFALNGIPVGNHAIWTLAFSNPTSLGINNFRGAPDVGFSSTESYWAAVSPGALAYEFLLGGTDLNFQAEFTGTAVPEPGTIALSALALGALFLRRRQSLAVLPFILLAAAPTFAATKDVVPAGDWAQIKAEYERHRHQITNNQSHGPYQGWNTTFSSTGFLVTPKEGNWTWGLNLKSYGLADQIQPISAPIQSTTNKNELRHQHGNLTHWFINAPSGLEEGWTIQQRPAGSAKELLVILEVQGTLSARADGNGAHFLNPTQQNILNYNGLKAWDATGKALAATMTASANEIQISVNQQDAQYPITIDPTAQQAYLKASNAGVNDQFGWSVAISGETIVVGANREDSNATGVNGDQANGSAADSGAAYVFTRSAGVWAQQAYLKASNTNTGDQFGTSVAISGNKIVVGAPLEDSNSTTIDTDQNNNSASNAGAAYVFNRSVAGWTQEAYLKASDTSSADNFGSSVAISGNKIVVGAPGIGSAEGGAYVFTNSGSAWSQQTYLQGSNTGLGDSFGSSVAIFDSRGNTTIVVGAPLEDSDSTTINSGQSNNSASNAGAAYVFSKDIEDLVWTQQAYLKASNTGIDDRFGWSVAISGDTVVVGARDEASNSTTINSGQSDSSAAGAGAAYVFTRSGIAWAQQAYLKAFNTGVDDAFGSSVAISGNTVVVGANGEDSNSTTINSGQSDNSAAGAGAAYVFTRSGIAWAQQAYLKAFNTNEGDVFGRSVAISGTTIVVGANGEASNSTSINSGQSDNSAADAGAAYVFLFAPNPNVTISSSPTNLLFSSTGSGCAPGANLATPQILPWTPASSCTVTFGTPQSGGPSTQYVFSQWEDSSTNAARTISAPATDTTYTATFNTQHLLTVTANPPAGGTVTPAAATFFNANSLQPVTATPTGCYAFSNWSGATVTSGNVTMSAPVNLTANFTLPTSTTTTKGPVLTMRGTPNRYRQSISVTNTTATTADISVALSTLGNNVSIVSTPTGTSTTCLPPAASPYFTLTNVPAGQARVVTIDFNAPSAAALTYTATAITGPGPR